MKKPNVEIYTDGACSPNPGTGGWGAILVALDHGRQTKELSGGERDSTNNRMELMAAIRALQTLKQPSKVTLYTDSQYLRNAFTQGWLENWQRNGWRTAAKKPVANEDLWRELLKLDALHTIRWEWVMGHAGHEYNERCDQLAVQARRKIDRRN